MMSDLKTASILVAAILLAASVADARADPLAPQDSVGQTEAAPPAESRADAEVLLWTIQTQDVDYGNRFMTTQQHHIRLKVLTVRGVSQHGTVSIPVLEGTRLTDVAARTVSPDGSTHEVTPQEIHDQVLVRAHGLSVRRRSFAFPTVVPGSILDYSFRVTRETSAFSYFALLPIQLDIPVRRVELEFMPIIGREYAIRPSAHVGTIGPLVSTRPGHYTTTVTNVPAHEDEALAPSDFATRLWILGYYPVARGNMGLYWDAVRGTVDGQLQRYWEPPGFFFKTTRDVIAGARTDTEKIQLLDEFLRSSIRNVEALPESAAALRAGFKANDRPWDALRKHLGTPYDIDMLMYLMARHAGLSPLRVYTTGRWNPFFDREHESGFMLTSLRIAFRQPEGLFFASPASPELPLGWLPDDEEGQLLFLPDAPADMFEAANVMPPESSRLVRNAELELAADGSAKARVRIAATGHAAMDWTRRLGHLTLTEQLDRIQTDLQARLPGALVRDVVLEPARDRLAAFSLSYAVALPLYASAAGRRLLVPPFFFQTGRGGRLTADARRHPLAIDYASTECDTVRIRVPANLRFEITDVQPPVPLPWGRFETTIETDRDGRSLLAVRRMRIGEGRLRVFPPFVYPAARAAFGQIAQREAQVVVLSPHADPAR